MGLNLVWIDGKHGNDIVINVNKSTISIGEDLFIQGHEADKMLEDILQHVNNSHTTKISISDAVIEYCNQLATY